MKALLEILFIIIPLFNKKFRVLKYKKKTLMMLMTVRADQIY